MKTIILLIFILISTMASAADLQSLSTLFKQNFDTFYQPRLCGKNITLLLSEASKRNIDLSNSYVLKIEGAGFLETGGLYTRVRINEREMLGYFHYVLIADDYVFDFDLAEPLILKIEDYIRLQFTPAYTPYIIFGINYDPLKELPYWTVTNYHWRDFLNPGPQKNWVKKMNHFIDLKKVMTRDRIR